MSVNIYHPTFLQCVKYAYAYPEVYGLRSFGMDLRPHSGSFRYGNPKDVVDFFGRVVAIAADEGTGVWVYTPDGKFVG